MVAGPVGWPAPYGDGHLPLRRARWRFRRPRACMADRAGAPFP